MSARGTTDEFVWLSVGVGAPTSHPTIRDAIGALRAIGVRDPVEVWPEVESLYSPGYDGLQSIGVVWGDAAGKKTRKLTPREAKKLERAFRPPLLTWPGRSNKPSLVR